MDSNPKTIPFFSIEDIPKPEENPDFWSLINNPHLSQCLFFLILNEIRKYNPEELSPEACRTQLAKLKGWQELLDLPKGLAKKDEPLPSDELPQH